ncbi:MAG: tetratricopeptide repeat protein [Thermaceae bacterium]|nr:tetratricopeptide repeat protein [Thermaceae bacterium]
MLRTLGGLRLEGSSFGRSKPLLLLAYLALEGAKTRRELADLFYLDAKDPRDSLSTALGYLKREASAVEADAQKVWTSQECDAPKLLQLLDGGQLGGGLELYQGAFLAGVDLLLGEELEEWVYQTRELLAGRVRETRLQLGEKALAKGRYEVAARHAEAAYGLGGAPELDPEDLKRLYPLLYLGKSLLAGALRREAEGFGIALEVKEPAPEPIPAQPVRNNLPLQTTSFVGRDPELLEVARLLGSPEQRLLTLHGLGGAGKTRLALQVAHQQLEDSAFTDGVFFVALDAISTLEAIPLAIAEALVIGLQAPENPLAQIQQAIGEQHILLVLDNFEHLVEGATSLVALLAACPNLKALVTSRERLGVAEEWVFPLGGLGLPGSESRFEDAPYSDAMQLFVQRAKRVKLDFALEPTTLPLVLKICRLVEGYPLGLELAAAWVRMLPPEEIAQEIERNLDFLSSAARNSPARQRSLRAVFESAWNSLNPKEQAALRKLSVFRGGFRREAAGEVMGATLPLLASLVDKSLLRTSANGRYDRHALLYGYMQEKLAEHPEEQQQTRDLHAAFFLKFAEHANGELSGDEQALWLGRLGEEHDNLQAALEWVLSQSEAEIALRITRALSRFWDIRGHFAEGRAWLVKALALPAPELKDLRARALNGVGVIAKDQGDFAAAKVYLEESLALHGELGSRSPRAVTLNNLGVLAYQQNDYLTAQEYYRQSLSILRELDNPGGVAYVLQNLGNLAHDLGEYALARQYKEESLEISRQLEDGVGIAIALANLSITAIEQGEYGAVRGQLEESLKLSLVLGDSNGIATAKQLLGYMAFLRGESEEANLRLEECQKLFRQTGDKMGLSSTLLMLGEVQLQNDLVGANALFQEALSLLEQLKQPKGTATALEKLAAVAAKAGRWAQGVHLYAAASRLREQFKTPLPPSEQARYQRTLNALREGLDKKNFDSSWAIGQRWTLEEAVGKALEPTALAGSKLHPPTPFE